MQVVRVVTWNILGGRGHRRGENPAVRPSPPRPGHAVLLAEALEGLGADIVLLQEAPPPSQVEAIASRLGFFHAFFAARWPGDSTWVGGFPGAICARWPLTAVVDHLAAAGAWPDHEFMRHWGSAVCRTPVGTMRLHTTHLCADWGGRQHETVRIAEADRILGATAASPDPLLLAGDLNGTPGSAPHRRFLEAGWRDAVAEGGADGQPTSPVPNPARRIDHVLLSPGAPWTARRAMVPDGPPFAPPADDPDALALSDHLPVRVELVARE